MPTFKVRCTERATNKPKSFQMQADSEAALSERLVADYLVLSVERLDESAPPATTDNAATLATLHADLAPLERLSSSRLVTRPISTIATGVFLGWLYITIICSCIWVVVKVLSV